MIYIPLFNTNIFFRKKWWLEDETSFLKMVPQKEGHVNFRGGIPLQMKETEPLAGANRGNGVHHQQISLCGQIEGDHRFRKKTWRSVGWVSMEFVVPDLKLKKCRCCWIWCFSYEFHFFVKIRLLFLFWLGDGLIVFRNYKLWKTAWGCSSNFVGWIGRWVNQADLPLTIVKFRKTLVETNQSLHQKGIEQK